MTDKIAVYHWWDHPGDAKPYSNLRTPIVLSIATLRAVSDVPICVLDLSGRPKEDWGEFPQKLGFYVTEAEKSMQPYQSKVAGWQHLSRFFDLKHWGERQQWEGDHYQIMYVDSDVFWLRNPFPLSGNPEKMCINRWNTGFFYFEPWNNKEFWEIFESYTMAAVYSQDIRKVLKQYVGYDAWYEVWDEMTLTYMARHHPDVFNFIPVDEHATLGTIHEANLDNMKMLHANGLMVANPLCKVPGERDHSRGLVCLAIKEFYENIRKVLPDEDIAVIFTPRELKHYVPQALSLFGDLDKLLATKDARSGQYHLLRALRPPVTLMV